MPARRKNESIEAFRERSRLYMDARAIKRGRRPIRRVQPLSPPREHFPTAPTRNHYTIEEWQRRYDYRAQVGHYPERIGASALDDAALVAAMRRERRGHG